MRSALLPLRLEGLGTVKSNQAVRIELKQDILAEPIAQGLPISLGQVKAVLPAIKEAHYGPAAVNREVLVICHINRQ